MCRKGLLAFGVHSAPALVLPGEWRLRLLAWLACGLWLTVVRERPLSERTVHLEHSPAMPLPMAGCFPLVLCLASTCRSRRSLVILAGHGHLKGESCACSWSADSLQSLCTLCASARKRRAKPIGLIKANAMCKCCFYVGAAISFIHVGVAPSAGNACAGGWVPQWRPQEATRL
jgi:hypothetical protein